MQPEGKRGGDNFCVSLCYYEILKQPRMIILVKYNLNN